MNFPENAVIETDNVVYSVIGDVSRRGGIDYETNFQLNNIGVGAAAKSSFKWENVGGDGSTQMVVQQLGSTLYFYNSSTTTIAAPLSTKKLSSTISIFSFLVSGSAADPSQYECTYAAGNGYLFVYNPVCEPFYVAYNSGTVTMTATKINVQVRDTWGIPDELAFFNSKPATLSTEHQYNLVNQGWSLSWSATLPVGAVTTYTNTGSFTYLAPAIDFSTFPITDNTTQVQIIPSDRNDFNPAPIMTGTVTAHVNGSITVTIISKSSGDPGGFTSGLSWVITPFPSALFSTYVATFGAYPSNAEQWWEYRNTNVTAASPTGNFDPAHTKQYVLLDNSQAPQGSVIFSAFNQDRATPSYTPGVTTTTTTLRPKTGAFFQGRTWYTGVDANFQATGDVPFYTWTENIYFSQLSLTNRLFGSCYQVNDPTSDQEFDILPTDGGVIYVQGSGSIYKLFPVQNGMLIFAANGIWFITGSQGIGFSANDYTITKISGVRSNSTTSFVDVLGWPIFWNEEGIYTVTPSQQGGGLEVNNLVIGTIASYYSSIPLVSKKFARGTYNPLDYTIQWVFRSTPESSITTRYQYDSILVFNTSNKAFYVHTIAGTTRIHDCLYVSSPGSSNSGDPVVKYIVSSGTNLTFAEEKDFTNYVDFHSGTSSNFVSTFTTGYMLHGKGAMKFQVPYIYMFLNANSGSYKINGQWNWSTSGNSGKWTNTQIFTLLDTNYSKLFNRLRIRGRGNALQLKVTSQDGQPFDFSGWALYENINAGV